MNTKMNLANGSKHRDRRTCMRTQLLPIALFLVALIACDRSAAEEDRPAKAALFERMGSHQRKITASADAQKYFDQGLIWMYAFNHDEAIRSFTHAAELDENCAMAWWGISLAAGPQYNHAVMTGEPTAMAWGLCRKPWTGSAIPTKWRKP
jgi:hypothetical protein